MQLLNWIIIKVVLINVSLCFFFRVSNLLGEHNPLGNGVYRSVGEWLEAIKMGRYTEIFMENGYSSMDTVAQVTLEWVDFLIILIEKGETYWLEANSRVKLEENWKYLSFRTLSSDSKEALLLISHINNNRPRRRLITIAAADISLPLT